MHKQINPMKMKTIGVLLLAALTFVACDDNTGSLGMSMIPDSDKLHAHTTTFEVSTQSLPVDSVFAKTSTGYVGQYTDNEFGTYTAGFLTELNCTDNLLLPDPYEEYMDGDTLRGRGFMAGDSVCAVQLVLYYTTWFGDSLNPCRISAYELNQKLDKNRYTSIDPEKYYDAANLLERKAYTAYDMSVPDSIRNATDVNGNSTYYPSIVFPMKKSIGDRILQLNREYRDGKNNYFANADNFINNVFKGVYIKHDYGDGTILYVDQVALRMQFRFHYTDSLGVALKKKVSDDEGKAGDDSLYYSMQTVFASTKEVIQANQFHNTDKIKEKAAEKQWTYIKSPAGIFTQATMPYDSIYEVLSQDTLNAVKLTFTNYNIEDDRKFKMDAPSNVLLVRKQEMKEFFETNKIYDNVTSFTTAHNSSGTNQYTFANIARLVTTCINEKKAAREQAGDSWNEDKWMEEHPDWDKVVLIPVSITYDNSNSTNPTVTGIQHDLEPGYARLQGGPEGPKLTLEVTYTRFQD